MPKSLYGNTNINSEILRNPLSVGLTATTTGNTYFFSGDSSNEIFRITQAGSGNSFIVEDSTRPDSSPFVIDASGNTGIGLLVPSEKLHVSGNTLISGTLSATTLYGDGTNLTGISGGGSFTGGTVTGSTTFTSSVSADTISATTLYVSGNSVARPYKVYTALLTQAGTNAPTAIVLENTLGGDIVWSYGQVGLYIGTLNGAFPDYNKVFFQGYAFSEDGTGFNVTSVGGINSNRIAVFTTYPITESSSNDILNNTPIEIRVYN